MADLDAALTEARAAAESLMVASCKITRATGQPVFDTATGTYSAPPATLVYRGPCKVQDSARSVVDADAGELPPALADHYLALKAQGLL